MRAYLFKLRVPSIVVALGLQVSPMVRAVLPHVQTASNILAIVFKWGAGAAATLGSIQAVSGASTKITSASSAQATEGESFNMRLTTGPETAGYWEAAGMPTGINLIKISSSNWVLAGIPTEHGTFPVSLLAKENASTTNPERRVTGTLTLTVIGGVVEIAPSITSQPANATVTEGDNASFSVTADGTTPLAYQWRFNGAAISGETSANLSLSSVTTQQSGQYDVVISNSAGSVTSSAATLTVNELVIPPSITSQPTGTAVTEGGNASFSVVADGTGPFSYQWRFNGAAISGETSATLSLSSVTTQQSGQYDVVISNSAGSVTSSAATLTVEASAPPVVETITVQAGKVEMSFTPQAGKTYVLESTGDGGQNWSTAQTIDTPVGSGPTKVQIPIGTARYEFFRLRVQ